MPKVDYRNFDDVGAYKEALEATGRRLSIYIAWRIDQRMKETGASFPEVWAAALDCGAVIPITKRKKRAA